MDSNIDSLDATFRDYVVWHRNGAFDADAYAQAKQHWQGRLPTLPLAPILPLRSSGSDQLQFTSVHHLEHTFSEQFWPDFVSNCKQHRLLPSSVLMTSLVDVLRLWSQDNYFTINTTLFNRQYVDEQIDQVIGDFTEGILFQTPDEEELIGGDSTRSTSFAARCTHVQRQLLSDISYSQYSSIEVIRDLQRHRPGCLMPVVFTCVLPPGHSTTEQGKDKIEAHSSSLDFDFELAGRKTQTSQVMLDFQVFPSLDGKNIELHLDYMDVFEPAVVHELFGVFASGLERSIAAGLEANSDSSWDRFASFAQLSADHLKPRSEANATDRVSICKEVLDLPDHESMLTDGFVRMAQEHPDRVAIQAIDGIITYGKLLEQAAHAANRIEKILASSVQDVPAVRC
ncbi:hypothetical protein [Sporisorium scitamineum]|uniref:Uncharacterized protein n=1 Tax=Sporisorium scitamineum TaxID=49012 RepID=A0A0F7S240_9BASI|nr:hypothetical protein [Sporisorium scitamineum]